MRRALEEPVAQIIDAIKSTLDKTPPELAADIMDRGIVLAGGGALLTGLDERLRHETQMPVHLAESPLTCVAVGSGRSLEEFEAIHRSSAGAAPLAQRPPVASGRLTRTGPVGTSPTLWQSRASQPHRTGGGAGLVRPALPPAPATPHASPDPVAGGASSSAALVVLSLALITRLLPRAVRRRAARRAERRRDRAAPVRGRAPSASRARSATPTASSAASSRARREIEKLRTRDRRELRQQRRQQRRPRARENATLRKLLDYKDAPTLPGRLRRRRRGRALARRADAFEQQVVIAAGSAHGVRVDDPVVTADGPRRPGHARSRRHARR